MEDSYQENIEDSSQRMLEYLQKQDYTVIEKLQKYYNSGLIKRVLFSNPVERQVNHLASIDPSLSSSETRDKVLALLAKLPTKIAA